MPGSKASSVLSTGKLSVNLLSNSASRWSKVLKYSCFISSAKVVVQFPDWWNSFLASKLSQIVSDAWWSFEFFFSQAFNFWWVQLSLMKLINLKSTLKSDYFDASIGIKIPFFTVSVTIELGHSLLTVRYHELFEKDKTFSSMSTSLTWE